MAKKTSQKTKAGNQGDVPKHVSLILIAGKLLQISNSSPFIYLETHTGYPSYSLTKGGSWEEGAERLEKGLAHAAKGVVGGHPMTNPLFSPYAPFNEYLDMSGFRVTKKTTYYGSSEIVYNLASVHRKNINMVLHDTDETTYKHLASYYLYPPHQVMRQDGYEGANIYCRQIQPTPNLVLIDPFAIGENQDDDIRPLVSVLVDKGIPFLCWTPRLGPIGKHSKVSKKYPEEPKYVAFQEWAKGKGLKPILLSWKKPNPHMWGCCLLTNDIFEQTIRRAMEDLCVIMNHAKGTKWVLWP